MPRYARSIVPILLLLLGIAAAPTARGQDIEPRSYSNAPVGVNFLIAGFGYAQGGPSFDPSLPVTDAHLKTPTAVLAYARSIDVFGMSGKFDAIVPYGWLSGSANYDGSPLTRDVHGFNDPKFRVSVNFYGAPALGAAEFRNYHQDLIIGASLQVSVPWGQYDSSRLVNLGTHRWSFKPELGVSKTAGPWTLEFAAATTFYTDNDNFYGGNLRSQDPIYSMQGHAIYNLRSGIWTSLDVTYFTGGRTRINDVRNNDLQQNWRVGATAAFPIDVRNSIKLYASTGVSARTGNNYDLLGIAWQYRWG
ncbi:MAG: transporter, partial [Casimicrobiaceae bacterium]